MPQIAIGSKVHSSALAAPVVEGDMLLNLPGAGCRVERAVAYLKSEGMMRL